MVELIPSMLLQRLPDLRIRSKPGDNIQVMTDDHTLICDASALAILALFYRPCTVAKALEQLPAQAGVDTAHVAENIMRLYAAGILREVSTRTPGIRIDEQTYDSAPIHVAMLNDRSRVVSFLEGVREVVRPGDVVLDLGTGIGIFAIAAAQAGARHVYAVEAGAIGHLAQANFAANGFAERITLLQGWSNQISLPERADVLISEMVGNEPTADYMLEVMMDARKRLLKPDARMVPGRVRIYGLPVTVPQAELERHFVVLDATLRWKAWYGMEWSHLLAAGSRDPELAYFSVRPYMARDWCTFSEPVLLADINFMQVTELMIDLDVPFVTTADGLINGLLVYFETELGPTARLSLHPAQTGSDSFRYAPVRLLAEPLEVQTGEQLQFTYRYRVPGKPGGLAITRP